MTSYKAREIDELLQDPEFLASPEYQIYKNLVEQGGYPSVRDAIISLVASAMEVREQDHAAWPDEIQAAIQAERSGRVFPPMFRIASSISDVLETGNPNLIPESSWRMLTDFLCCAHRGKKGGARSNFNRQCDSDVLEKYERLIQAGFSPTQAQDSLAATEGVDVRTVQRTLRRAREDREMETLRVELSGHDMLRFFRAEGDVDKDDA